MLKGHDDIGRVHWVTKVRELLYKYGIDFVWLEQEIGDVDMFVAAFRIRKFRRLYETKLELRNSKFS